MESSPSASPSPVGLSCLLVLLFLVTALFDCQIRMQMAASFAEMDEIRSIFAQIPHSKESLLQSEGEKRERGREKQTGRREGNMYADLRLTGASEAGANLCCLPSPFGTIKAMTTMMMSASNSESSHLCRDLLSCRAPRPKRLSGFVGRHALKSKGFPFNTRRACPTTLGDASKTDAAV